MGYRDEHQHGRADDEREDSEIEQQCCGRGNFTDQGQFQILKIRREERKAGQPRTHPGEGRQQQAGAHPAHGQDAQAVLDPPCSASQILQQESDRQRDAGCEAPARQIVSAQEEIGRKHNDHREHPLHNDRGDHQIVAQRLADFTIGLGIVKPVLQALLFGNLDAVGRGAEATQECEDSQRDDGENGDLAHRIEAAEINQDDIHHISAAGFGIGPLEEEVANCLRNRARHHRIGNDGKPGSAGDGEEGVKAPARPSRDADSMIDSFQPFRQPTQTKQ